MCSICLSFVLCLKSFWIIIHLSPLVLAGTIHGVRSKMDLLKAPSELDLSTTDSISVPEKWRKWRQAMELYIEFSLATKSEKRKM